MAAAPEAHVNSQFDRIIFITVHGANNLKNSRTFGTINPYALIRGFDGPASGGNYAAGTQAKTVEVRSSTNPVWSRETHAFLISPRVTKFSVGIQDGGTQVAGVTYPLLNRPFYDQGSAAIAPQGVLKLTYKVFPVNGVLRHARLLSGLPADQTVAVKGFDRLAAITVLRAQRLPNKSTFGTSDPYVKLQKFDSLVAGGNQGDGTASHTGHKQDKLDPVWNECHLFLLSARTSSLKISIYDKNNLMDSKMCGSRVQLASLDDNARSLALAPGGSIDLQATYVPLNKLAAQDPNKLLAQIGKEMLQAGAGGGGQAAGAGAGGEAKADGGGGQPGWGQVVGVVAPPPSPGAAHAGAVPVPIGGAAYPAAAGGGAYPAPVPAYPGGGPGGAHPVGGAVAAYPGAAAAAAMPAPVPAAYPGAYAAMPPAMPAMPAMPGMPVMPPGMPMSPGGARYPGQAAAVPAPVPAPAAVGYPGQQQQQQQQQQYRGPAMYPGQAGGVGGQMHRAKTAAELARERADEELAMRMAGIETRGQHDARIQAQRVQDEADARLAAMLARQGQQEAKQRDQPPPIAQPAPQQYGGREGEIRQVIEFTGCTRQKAEEAFKRESSVQKAVQWVLEH